ncbi:MAG TPA: APC family permease [Fimbriimonadaceae bacterium]|nr:APC family permease [Fimbriimonadaceae bacterium]
MSDNKGFSWGALRRFLLGRPIATSRASHERLSPLIGLPVFASDALSSVAYATEAILSILILLAVTALQYQFYITLAVCFLILVVAISYQMTIQAYPTGGGSYIVATDNLGAKPGLIAGAALMIDYVLTVAVSIAAGVAAITSAYPSLHNYLVPISLFFIALVAFANLRGVKESGALFAIPTYGFVVAITLVLGFAIARSVGSEAAIPQVVARNAEGKNLIGIEASLPLWFIILRSFAAGCTALTGIEAVSDGVQAFKAPEAKNAITTLRWMAVILLSMFLGLGYVVQHIPSLALHSTDNPEFRTVVSQVAAWAFGSATHPLYYFVQFATFAILILAANTAFADFPRLSSFIARDGFLPRPLARQGDRLVFHNGIIILAVAAGILVYVFKGELDGLLPLYAVGVFTAFSLSQFGMVVHWFRKKPKGWAKKAALNIVGTTLCVAVLLIISITKFLEGAWVIFILLPVVFALFIAIRKRYDSMTGQLAISEVLPKLPRGHTSLLLVPRVHNGILAALNYARITDPDCQAIHVAIDERRLVEIQELWAQYGANVPLVMLRSPYRSLIEPVLDYVDELLRENNEQVITVIVPEAVSTKWYHRLLQENVAQQLKTALGMRPNVVVTNVKYFLK